MLTGDPGTQAVHFVLPQFGNPVSLLPADCDGAFPLPGTPNYYAAILGGDLVIREFHADWTNPGASSFSAPFHLPVTPFSFQNMGIPQKDSDKLLTPLNDRLMYRLQFRNFGNYQAMVVNHTVDVGSHVGVRWYELWKTSGNWFIRQQSTYAPDTLNRWMGSIAMDPAGNIALGYSVSDASVFPSVRITGRMKNDPLGEMTISEMTLFNGTGSQTGIWSGQSRWGDYSSMTSDPIQPFCFWYTQEYYQTTAVNAWRTRVASFSFANILGIEALADPAILCDSGEIQLNVKVSGGNGTYDFSWTSEPPGFVSGIINPVAYPSGSTKYIVEVTSGDQVKQDTVLVSFIPPPMVFAGKDTSICRYVDVLPLAGYANNNISVLWSSSGDGLFDNPEATNTHYHPGTNDKLHSELFLSLTAIPRSPCLPLTSTMRLVIDTCAGIGEESANLLRIALYPNPAKERLTVGISGIADNEVTFTFMDMRGLIIYQETVAAETSQLLSQTDLTGFPEGIVFLKVETRKSWVVRPFVIRK
ncbi:MAG: T9SS type A sorting domain-containing protein, partial [bacterium]